MVTLLNLRKQVNDKQGIDIFFFDEATPAITVLLYLFYILAVWMIVLVCLTLLGMGVIVVHWCRPYVWRPSRRTNAAEMPSSRMPSILEPMPADDGEVADLFPVKHASSPMRATSLKAMPARQQSNAPSASEDGEAADSFSVISEGTGLRL
jgi:hypothetical protein